MQFTFEEIKTALKEHWTEIEAEAYPDDWLTEFSDGLVPVYNSDIIDDWREMPAEFNESGRDVCGEDSTILERMKADLWEYYRNQTFTAYEQLRRER